MPHTSLRFCLPCPVQVPEKFSLLLLSQIAQVLQEHRERGLHSALRSTLPPPLFLQSNSAQLLMSLSTYHHK